MEKKHKLITVEEEGERDDDFQEMLSRLPTERHWINGRSLYLYQNFWCPSKSIKAFVSFQQHFKACDTDLILASMPKSGTTWLKALAFAIVNRARYTTLQETNEVIEQLGGEEQAMTDEEVREEEHQVTRRRKTNIILSLS